ncbi:hypothetical protein CL689_07175 [Candidatus Saccharibacteria bacterium]|nr:hypothetical protein [Candidatus Saccharibacteria bacterium]|tara:strand:- start:5314 stop:5742 length:429 start_codon:yes stop_codon:yes gene_type:complete
MDAAPQETTVIHVEQEAEPVAELPVLRALTISTHVPPSEGFKKNERLHNHDADIERIESALAGKGFEIEVTEKSISIGSSNYVIPTYAFKDQKEVYKKLIELAGTSKIRVFFPGTMGTQDFVADRVNFIFDDKGMFVRCSKG